ncbi:DUF6193 family natural product biosynthesis protein [Streptomyces sp. NPDC006602]|uniref:DUF6193 family natural product biosynthesis protein n=1 Tax=Streptomyces sp. NPDC006602 TaxID=3364751 RepID=UPI003686BB74
MRQWVLCSSSDLDEPSLEVAPAVVAQRGGRFQVKADRWGDIIGETDPVGEAIVLVVARTRSTSPCRNRDGR